MADRDELLVEEPLPGDVDDLLVSGDPIISTVTLDLQRRNIATINLKQYDEMLRVIYIKVCNLGVPVDILQYQEAYVQFKRPDGQFIVNTLTPIEDPYFSHYELTVSKAMVELSGVCQAEVTITDGRGVATTMTFSVLVDASVVTPDEYADIPEFEALVTYRNQANAAAADAQISAANAYDSEMAAATSERNAASSAHDAAISESNAATSETNAANSASAAATSASNAATSETNAATSETNAATSATTATNAATSASTSETNAAASATTATNMASSAMTSATGAGVSAQEAKAWAVGPNGTPSAGTDTENAKYYYQQVAALFASLAASIIPYDNTTSQMTADDVQEAVDELKDMLPFKFGVDSNGKYGYYKAGEQTVTPFSSGAEGVLPVNPSSTSGMNIWIVTTLGDNSENAEIVY